MFKPGDIVTREVDGVLYNGIILEVSVKGEPLLVKVQWMTPGSKLNEIQNVYDIRKLVPDKRRNRRARKK